MPNHPEYFPSPGWCWALYFEPRDLWIGVRWKTRLLMDVTELTLWICIVPAFPLEIQIIWGKPWGS